MRAEHHEASDQRQAERAAGTGAALGVPRGTPARARIRPRSRRSMESVDTRRRPCARGLQHESRPVQDRPERVAPTGRRRTGCAPAISDEADGGDDHGGRHDQHASTIIDQPSAQSTSSIVTLVVEVELVGRGSADERQLEDDEPEPAREQEARQLGARLAAQRRGTRRCRSRGRNRRAEVGDPAREEQRRRRGRDGSGVRARDAEEVARMVERHDDHDDAANKVDRFDRATAPQCHQWGAAATASISSSQRGSRVWTTITVSAGVTPGAGADGS